MLRLHDPRTGGAAPVVPARRGELRTYLAGPGTGTGQPTPAAGVRPALLADLIRRIAELQGLLVIAWQNISGGREATAGHEGTGERDGAGSQATCAALNIYPADYAPAPPDAFDIGIAVGTPAMTPGTRWVHAAPLRAGHATVAGLTERGLDPLALRLALLREHYRCPLELGWEELAAADGTLRRWREQVADWATHPSKPMPAQSLAETAGAFDDDLDIPAALRTLESLASDAGTLPGAKFETFVYLDRVLALDLARDIGR